MSACSDDPTGYLCKIRVLNTSPPPLTIWGKVQSESVQNDQPMSAAAKAREMMATLGAFRTRNAISQTKLEGSGKVRCFDLTIKTCQSANHPIIAKNGRAKKPPVMNLGSSDFDFCGPALPLVETLAAEAHLT
jgi:hypothetical protein